MKDRLTSWGFERAERYALCGQGDRLGRGRDGVSVVVRPMGCGEGTCPRCSRRRGVRVLRALEHRFRTVGHGVLYHLVLTQRVLSEPLAASRDRMEAKWVKAQKWLRCLGALGSVAVVHCTWSRHGGFHYHMHVVAEVTKEVDFGSFSARWQAFRDVGTPIFVKRVSEGRTAKECGEPVDLIHGVDAVGAGIGYVVGEVLKGVGRFAVDKCPTRHLAEVVEVVRGLKRLRLYGSWRTAVKEAAEAAKALLEGQSPEEREKEMAAEAKAALTAVDTVDKVREKSLGGDGVARALMRGLRESYDGSSLFCEGVRAFCLEALVVR